MKQITLGGDQSKDEERIYPKDAHFTMPDGIKVSVTRSRIAAADMPQLFARHEGRYFQVGVFCRPGYRVLDFPCGSGYAAALFAPFGVRYEGRDIDTVTVEYARQVYGAGGAQFGAGDLRKPDLPKEAYEVIGCIEGLEHIEMEHQDALINAFKDALKQGGVLVISSPENPDGRSGASSHNQWHVGELTRDDFMALLRRHFPAEDIELVTCPALLSSGVTTSMFLGICHKH